MKKIVFLSHFEAMATGMILNPVTRQSGTAKSRRQVKNCIALRFPAVILFPEIKTQHQNPFLGRFSICSFSRLILLLLLPVLN